MPGLTMNYRTLFCYKISSDKIVLPVCENQLHTAMPRLVANMGCLF